MYILLNQGRHPFFVKGDSFKSYFDKLSNLKPTDIKLDDKFSLYSY